MSGTRLHLPAGTAASGPYGVEVTPRTAGWRYSGVRVIELAPGASHTLSTHEDEVVVLPLAGGATVDAAGVRYELAGRPDVFTAVTDVLQVPPGTELTISCVDGGRFALPSARSRSGGDVVHHAASSVRVELRGAGQSSRQVSTYLQGGTTRTERLQVCEVLTPAGNWSSYPPHKHDEHHETERELEEIYLFEVRRGPDGPGFAVHHSRGTADGGAELTVRVRSGDVVLVPDGFHGPTAAAPGYDLYYLNVMAGPADDGLWLVTDDPDHHWVRDTWRTQAVDARLPMTQPAAAEGTR